MKRCHLILILTCLNCFQVQSQDCVDICTWPKVYLNSSTFSCSDYEIALYDEFSGTTLNDQIWKTHRFNLDHPVARLNNPWEEQLYMDENVSVNNGRAQLTGKFQPGATWTNNDGETYKRDITSGMIETKDVFRYAYYEASIKIPGAGWWPAFWMWHHDEIDILENFWDDTKFNYNLYGLDECPEVNEFSANINDGKFHTYAVELTPFSLTYYFDGQPLPKKYYRFYAEDGTPLDVSCENPTIIGGQYYVNPVFPQSRARGFSPIINLAVLCKYGFGACQSSDPNCVAPYCFECSGSTDCDWGYPFDSNCNQTGEVPAVLEVDYVKIRERDYNICNSLFVYGDNCQQTGIQREPLSCEKNYCIGEIGNLYLEDLNGSNWLSEVQVLNVEATSDIDIISFDNYNIEYRQNFSGEGKITISYVGGCDVQNVFEYFVPSSGGEYEVINIDPCREVATIEFENHLCNNGALDIVNVVTIDEWGNVRSANFDLISNTLNVSYQGQYFVRKIEIEGVTPCQNVLNIEIDVLPCDECCPNGFEYDGANCYSGYHFVGVDGFIYDGKFYTTTNCALYPNNNCCPPGTSFDGVNCYYGEIDSGFDGFIWDDAFYTNLNCEKNCCPDGFDYDGVNCYSGYHFDSSVVSGFIYDGNFYTTKNCEVYLTNNCCPPGTLFDGVNCYYGKVPVGYEGFVYGNSFYVEPNCNTCCPPGAIFDGANCYYGIHFEEGEGFIYNNSFYTVPDCDEYPENECCPPGAIFDGANCYYGIHFGDGEGFIYGNSFYTIPFDCYDYYSYKVEKIVDNSKGSGVGIRQGGYDDVANRKIRVYPNPFSKEINIELGEQYMDVEEIRIFSFDGQLVKRIERGSLSRFIRITGLNFHADIFLIKVIYEDRQESFKVLKVY